VDFILGRLVAHGSAQEDDFEGELPDRGPEVAIGVLKAGEPLVCGTRHGVQRE